MENDYTGGDICIDGSTDCIGNDIVYGSRTDIHLKKAPIKREQSQACLSYVERKGVRQSQKASTEWSGLSVLRHLWKGCKKFKGLDGIIY